MRMPVDGGMNLTSGKCRNKKYLPARVAEGVDGCVSICNSMADVYAFFEKVWCPPPSGFRILYTSGVHPHHASWPLSPNELARIAAPLQDGRATFVGECGLDWHRMLQPREDQLACFQQQLQLAQELDRPLYLHARGNETTPVWDDFWRELSATLPARTHKGIVHCFDLDDAAKQTLVAAGFVMGVTRKVPPHITLADAQQHLILETDAPYFGDNVWRTAEAVAAHVGATREDVMAWSDATLARVVAPTC